MRELPSLLVGGISLLGDLTGIGRYAFEIARRLASDEEIRTSFYYGYISSRLRASESGEAVGDGISSAKKRIARCPWAKRALRRLLESASILYPGEFDIYWEPNIAPISALCAKSGSVVATVHDFSWLLYPQWHPGERSSYFKKIFPKGIAKVDKIITVSHFVREEAIALFNLDPAAIEVIHNGVDHSTFHPYHPDESEPFRKALALPRRFILFVGTLEPRKNVVRLIEAFRRLPARMRAECPLLLAGATGWENDDTLRLLRECSAFVHHLGYVRNRELALLYNLAEAFVFPSLYEGFGLPPLEAMACGTPVVVSRAGSLPEICGDAPLFVDPTDEDSIAAALETIIEDREERERRIFAGFQRAALFSWDESASRHRRLFLSLSKNRLYSRP